MKLTVEEHRDSIKRYGHLKPARGVPLCRRPCPGTNRTCSQEKGHRGPHVAHGRFRRVVAVWDRGEAAPAPPRPEPPARRGGRPVRPRSRDPVGLGEGLRDLLRKGIESAEELAWLAFFIAFVGFAIGGFLLIYLG